MTNALVFVFTTLIWGSTWIAIAMQVGPVPAMVSVFYRFASAALILVAFLAATGRLRLPARKDQPFIAAQALCLFSCNFLCFYNAAAYLPSGLQSVIFSLATVFNAVNARLFFGEAITPRAMIAGALGFAGVALLFAHDLFVVFDPKALKGVALCLLGTTFFSLGNMVSRRNSAAGVAPIIANGWGMAYGAIFLLAVILVTGTPVVAPPDARYLWALVFLSLFGTVIGFTTYLMLVQRMGTGKAAYLTVVTPLVALTLSTLFEGYRWDWTGVLGVALALAGSVVMFARRRA